MMLADREVTGYIDSVDNRTIRGWARSRCGRRPVLRVRINGCDAGFITPTKFRPDLAGDGADGASCGFEFCVPDPVDSIDSVSVSVMADSFELPFSSERVISPQSNRGLPREWRRGPDTFRLPSLFLLGAAKCGTTSLHNYLAQHPQVCMSNPKEPFYFEAQYERGPAFYFNRYFSHWRNEPIAGESRHRNLYLPYVAQRIFAFNPDAKLIAILRNPVERALCQWWHWYVRGMEPLPFREAILADWSRIESGRRYDTPEQAQLYIRTLNEQGQHGYRTYIDSGYYADQLLRFIGLYGKERLRVLWFEDLVANAPILTAEALEFIGADPAPAADFDYRVANASPSGMREHIHDRTISWLIDHYRPHNQQLEEMFGRSLAGWDHPFGQ